MCVDRKISMADLKGTISFFAWPSLSFLKKVAKTTVPRTDLKLRNVGYKGGKVGPVGVGRQTKAFGVGRQTKAFGVGRQTKIQKEEGKNGGLDRDRTDDLRNAIAALSQLSYEPKAPQTKEKGSGGGDITDFLSATQEGNKGGLPLILSNKKGGMPRP